MQADLAKQAEKEEKERIEKEKLQIIEDKILTLEQKKQEAQELLKQADEEDTEKNVTVVIKLPSGARLQHKFSKSAQIKHVRALVLIQEETTAIDFKIHSQFPKKEYDTEEDSLETAFSGSKNMMLMVQSLVDDSINKGDDEDEESSSESESSDEDDSE